MGHRGHKRYRVCQIILLDPNAIYTLRPIVQASGYLSTKLIMYRISIFIKVQFNRSSVNLI